MDINARTREKSTSIRLLLQMSLLRPQARPSCVCFAQTFEQAGFALVKANGPLQKSRARVLSGSGLSAHVCMCPISAKCHERWLCTCFPCAVKGVSPGVGLTFCKWRRTYLYDKLKVKAVRETETAPLTRKLWSAVNLVLHQKCFFVF